MQPNLHPSKEVKELDISFYEELVEVLFSLNFEECIGDGEALVWGEEGGCIDHYGKGEVLEGCL